MRIRALYFAVLWICALFGSNKVAASEVENVGSCTEKRYSELETEAQKDGGIGIYWFLYGDQSSVVSTSGKSLFTTLNSSPRPLVALQTQCPDLFSANDCDSARKLRGCLEVFRSHLQRDKDDCVRYVNEWNSKNPNENRDSRVYCQKELTRLAVYLAEERGGLISCSSAAYSCGAGSPSAASDTSGLGARRTFSTSAIEAPQTPVFSAADSAASGPILSPWDVANSNSKRRVQTVEDSQGNLVSNRSGVRTNYADTRASVRAASAEPDAGLADLSLLPGGANYVAPETKATCRLTRSENVSRTHQVVAGSVTTLAHLLPSFEGLDTLHLAGVQYLNATGGKDTKINPGYNAVLPHAEAAEKEKDPKRQVRLIILCGAYKKVEIGGTLGAKLPTGTNTYSSKNEVACNPMPIQGGGTDDKHRYAVATVEAHGTIYLSGNSLQLKGVPENKDELAITCSSRVVMIGSGTVYTEFLAGL